MRTASPLLALLLVACGSGAPVEPAPSPDEAPPAEAPRTESTGPEGADETTTDTTGASTTATRATPDAPAQLILDPAARRRLRAALTEGRRAAHEGRFADALAAFDRASEIAPASGRVRCEAAFVAHQAGEVPRADAHLVVALAALPPDERLDDPTARREAAMCLYNAGLVHEARGRDAEARSVLERSLALRENAVVRARLEALQARLGPAAAPDADVVLGPFPANASFEQIAARVHDVLCHRGGGGFSDRESPCTAIEFEIRRAGSPELEIAAIDLHATHPSAGGDQLWSVLAVRGAGTLEVALLAEGYSPGAFGMSVELTTRLESRDVLPGGRPEVIADVDTTGGDSDMGTCDYWGSEHRSSIVCSIDGGALRCIAIPVRDVELEQHEICGDTMDADGDGDYEEPLPGEVARDRRDGFELELRFDAGNATLARDPNGRSTGTPPVIGEQPLERLFERRDLAFPATWTEIDLAAG